MKAENKTRITAAEMKHMRTAKYAWMDSKRNVDILKELKTESILDNIFKYKTLKKLETTWIKKLRMIFKETPLLLDDDTSIDP
jgi:hypothetical protein